MSQNFFSNVSLLVRASANDMIMQALKAKSPAVINQKIQDLSNALAKLKDTEAAVKANKRIAEKKRDGLESAIAELKKRAEQYVAQGKDDLAGVQLKQKNIKQDALTSTIKAIVAMGSELETFLKARGVIDAKIDELQTAHDKVEQALQIAESKNETAQTLDDVSRLLQGAGVENAVEWAEQIQTKADVKLEMSLEKHSALLNAEDDPDVADELAQMKAANAAKA